jgi:glutaminyl-tRNA synthetase
MLVEGVTFDTKNSDGTVVKKTIPPAVRGWDDPRLYTLVALRRRGIPSQALLNFVEGLGVTDALTEIQTTRLEASIRSHLERSVPRLALVLDPIKVVIKDVTEVDEQELTVPYDPKKLIPGERQVKLTGELYIDSSDFREEDSPEYFRLAPNKVVGLLHVPFAIRAVSFSKDSTGRVSEIRAVKSEDKPKTYIHWVDASSAKKVVTRQYHSLFKTDTPNTLDWKEGGWADNLNPNSEVVFKNAVIEKALDDLVKQHSLHPSRASDDLVRFQALRTGYFAIDPETDGDTIVLNQIVSLREDKSK